MCKVCCFRISCSGSRVTRLTYTLGLFLVTVVAWVFRNWGDLIVPASFQQCGGGDCFQYMAVLRISFGFVLYHLLMCLCTIGVTTSRFYRAKFHNGCVRVGVMSHVFACIVPTFHCRPFTSLYSSLFLLLLMIP